LYGDPEKYFELHDADSKIESGSKLVREIVVRAAGRSIRLLDVGSGRGELLEAARRDGVTAVGLAFSQAMIRYAHDRYGVEVVPRSIESGRGVARSL
jgi:cyclopropane fatty-acyl-phospholipid synthase-like methyltransferase